MDDASFELLLGPIPQYSVDLEPRRVLGGPPSGPPIKRLSIGKPILAPLRVPQTGRAALDGYVRGMLATHKFFELHLAITLHPEDGEPFENAAVGVGLTGANENNSPISWSLCPLRSATPVTVTNSLGVSAKLRLIEPSATRSTEYEISDNFVEGFGEGESSFEWRFRRTRSTELSGVQKMFAVIMAPKDSGFEVQIIVSASVRRLKFGLTRYRARLPDAVSHVSWPGH